MHIPDGYLSPTSCVAAYFAVLPFWCIALRRVERQMHTRMVPLLAVFSAFSFVIMMFNLPLPGGTTGHATGIGIAAVVLGPWAGMLAIAIALTIQALFFGDGGISTLGANCLNMGVLGVGAAYLLYRALAVNAAPDSPRRVLAAGIAGYLAINLAALATAAELGVQALWFQSDAGVPLYAPYPMMIGHLSLAGIAEALVSGGLVSWLQRAEPALLLATAGTGAIGEAARSGWLTPRKSLALLGALLVLTPLGQLAGGTAWGEWRVEDYADPQKHSEIVAASANSELPATAPEGLRQLSTLWNSPLPDYALPFLPKSLGYVFSGMLGCGLSILIWLALGRALCRQRQQPGRD